MRIFVDAHVFDEGFQGTRTFIRGLYGKLAKMPGGPEIVMGAYSPERLEREFPGLNNFRFIRYPSTSKYRRLFWNLPVILGREKCDFAHFQYVVPPVKKTRYIVTIHDLLFNDFPSDFPLSYRISRNVAFRSSAWLADFITTDSWYSEESIRKHYGINSQRISVVPMGVDDRYFEAPDRNLSITYIKDRFRISNYILFVGRVEPRKNHAFLLRAYLDLRLCKEGVSLVFVGGRSLAYPELDGMLSSLKPDERESVRFIDRAGEEDLPHFYRAARIFVYPSKGEGFGIPPLEAGASGTDVLCSGKTSMADFTFFEDGLFDPQRYDEFRNKLSARIATPSPKEKLDKIRNEIRRSYSWERSVGLFMEMITPGWMPPALR